MNKRIIAAVVIAALSPSVYAAKYKLEVLGQSEQGKYSYATDISNTGKVIGVTQWIYDLPIDIAEIDFTDSVIIAAYDSYKYSTFTRYDKEITFTLADIESGNINADAQAFMLSFLGSKQNDYRYQKISDLLAVEFNNPTVERTLFDIVLDDYNGKTRSTSNYLNAVADNGVAVGTGSAPFTKIDFTASGATESETYYVREFAQRGIVITPSGDSVSLVPEYNEHGGASSALDVVSHDSGSYVVGVASYGITENGQTYFTDNCKNETTPEQVCIGAALPVYLQNRATLWKLNDQHEVVETINLGLGLEPKEGEEAANFSSARAVNKHGIAVGVSQVRYRDGDYISTYPVIFKEGEVIQFIDQDTYGEVWSGGARRVPNATAINDNNIVTGYQPVAIENVARDKAYYYNIDTEEFKLLDGLFLSASARAYDINNNGIIVGESDLASNSSSNRRKTGFVYNIATEELHDLNDLLPCYASEGSSELFPYTVTEARAINDDGVIVGTAIKTESKRDRFGEIIYDENNEAERESVVYAVKLTPISGEIEQCTTQEQEKYERQGASAGWASLLLIPLLAIRRRFFK